jgi:DNA-binding LacI/PurR family transcriptional regulator
MTQTRRSGPTLAVVARAACVSVSTVSKVINSREDVSPETRRRVEEVLARTGYGRPTMPWSARAGSGMLVDIVTHGIASSYASAILGAVEDYAHHARLDIVVSAVLTRTQHSQPARGWLDKIADRGTAGVLLVLVDLSVAQRAWLSHHRVPCVALEPMNELSPEVPSVSVANRAGAMTATEYLIGLGHRRIAILTGWMGSLFGRERLGGFQSAMAAAALPVPAEYVVHGDFAVESAYRAMGRLLDLPDPPTAVFVSSDLMALGAYDALRERGVRVPEQMSIVGFDDVSEARWAEPALTTLHQPIEEMAVAAMDTLVGMIRGTAPQQVRREFPATLVARRSAVAR